MNQIRGFSLIEILIVISILAAVVSLALPKLRLKTSDLNSLLRELNQIGRNTRFMAKIKNATYRIIFNLQENPSQFWIEYTSEPLDPQFWLLTLEEQINLNSSSRAKDTKQEKQSKVSFQKDTQLLKSPKSFPIGTKIMDVQIQNHSDPIQDQFAAIYCFNIGICEAAILIIETQNQKKAYWYFHPLTGSVTSHEQAINLNYFLIDQ